MVRAPYPARIAAGLIVTAIEETRKLPTLLVTLPMTAVSQTLQAGMRAQQNIAELAIKGDAALEMIFDKPSEQPQWARFDEDDDLDQQPPTRESPAAQDDATPESPAPEHNDVDTPAAGRFALYSSAPESVVAGDSDDTGAGAVTSATKRPANNTSAKKAPAKSSSGPAPEVVEYIEYDGLTLAQLRAKLRSVGSEDLQELLDYEKTNRNRAPFVTMLDNRIAAQSKRST
ncbi:lipid droplet-associated protein [Gordonia bronchialis]|uniref:lipid droplet-associated protein n=1 Tax=Gordonia bronchialis TaxID=2054 RepID=UPI001CBD864A|nr:lipid droplet-associated protein [Gordonia bronchialis]UAK38256.1 lipid droplet-associated protein [Gordonia bronchialis]